MKKSTYIYQLIAVIVFLVLIGLPLFQDVTHIFTLKKIEGENKAAAEMPKMDINRLDKFPPQFTSFYNENFPFRALFFQIDYRILLKKSPIKEVIFGRDNWLFLAKNGKVYQGLVPFTEEQIQFAVQNLVKRKKNYDSMGIKFYAVVAPTTYEIYPEYLPRHIFRAKKTRTDRFCESMQQTDIPFIYLKETLLKNKTAGQLYRKNDHHWNALGAYFAYKAIIDRIKQDFPEIPTYELTDFELTPVSIATGNLVSMLNDNFKVLFDEDVKYEVELKDSTKSWYQVKKVGYPCVKNFAYPWEYERVGETPFKDLPNIVVVRDSYFSAMIPFFFNSFSRSVAIFDAWRYRENMDIVSNENPKIVLLILTEANISSLFKIQQ